jgi:hypothetical protein
LLAYSCPFPFLQSLAITLDTEPGQNPRLLAYASATDFVADEDTIEEGEKEASPMTEEGQSQEEQLQLSPAERAEAAEVEKEKERIQQEKRLIQLDVQVDRYLSDELVRSPVDFSLPSGYQVYDATEDEISRRKRASLPPINWSVEYAITPRSDLTVGKTTENLRKIIERRTGLAPLVLPNLEALKEREELREKELSKNKSALERFYEDRRNGIVMSMPLAPGQVEVGSGGDVKKEGVLRAGTKEGDIEAAKADLREEESAAAAPTQQWKRKTSAVDRLRELARLGKEDKDREALADALELYERRGD